MTTNGAIVVRLLYSHQAWNAGERASFPVEKAKLLIKKGRAVLVDESVTLEQLGLGEATAEEAPAVDTRTHALVGAQVMELVQEIDDLAELQAIWEGEKQHPNHEGGRKGALQAIRARAEELKAEHEAAEEE
jgi:hypothetical protein